MAHRSNRTQKQPENHDAEDVSMLRTPIQLHGKTVEQILNSVHYGTPELRGLLLDECDIILECKVCRALFRDLANLISHKRHYCSKSALEDNHLAIARLPDEKVFVVQPQEPTASSSTASTVRQAKSKPSLDETIARIQSGELGHSHAFKVYTDAAQKLQRQKDEMKITTIRTKAIPTNPNAVFMDVNMTSVNIHERPAVPTRSASPFETGVHRSNFTRKAKERVNASKNKDLGNRVRTLRKDCKNSEELQKLLMKELKEIQHKVKQKAQGNEAPKQIISKGQTVKVKKASCEKEALACAKTVSVEEDDHSDSGLIPTNRHRTKSVPRKIVPVIKSDKSTFTPNKLSNDVAPKRKKETPEATVPKVKEPSKPMTPQSPLKMEEGTRGKKSLICPKCNRIYSTKQSLSFHTKIIHSSKKTFFPCLYCPSIFYYFSGVTRHLLLSHSKTKSEINSLKNKLRAKSYSKIVPQAKEEPRPPPKSSGVRSSSRHKSETFSNKTSPSSSYVLHSVKKIGKKLSAKMDAMDKSQAKEEVKETNSKIEKLKNHTSFSSPVTDVESVAVKKEPGTPSRRLTHINTSQGQDSERKMPAGRSRINILPPKSPPKTIPVRHKCKKCRRLFGRMLTFTNHIKVCQGKVTALSKRQRARRPRGKFATRGGAQNGLAASTRSQKVESVPSRTPLLKAGANNSITLKLKELTPSSKTPVIKPQTTDLALKVIAASSHITRSSRKDPTKVKEELDSDLEAPTRRGSNASIEGATAKLRSVSKEQKDSKTLEDKMTGNTDLNTGLKSEERASASLSQINSPAAALNSEKLNDPSPTSSSTGNVQSDVQVKTMMPPQRLPSVKPPEESSSSQTFAKDEKNRKELSKESQKDDHERNEQGRKNRKESDGESIKSEIEIEEADTVNRGDQHIPRSSKISREAEEKDSGVAHITRSSRNAKVITLPDLIPLTTMPKTRSSLPDMGRDRRSTSLERNVRGGISHLVPRASGTINATSKDSSHSGHVRSSSPGAERPRRKRKVPTRNIDAVEMLSKIHNPEKDSPPSKKLELSVDKPTRSKPSRDSERAGISRSQSRMEKEENGPKPREMRSSRLEAREGRLTKNRTRIFVLGRKKPTGRKLLRSYDNARVDKLIDIQNTKCLVCGEEYSQIFNLRRHVIRIHLQWSRYQCRLCRFASFDRSECTTHIVRNHKRAVDIEDPQAVNSCITDLAKQGSQAMNMKKNQTIRDKNKRENKDANIYARPNVKKMPRLAERKSVQEKEQSNASRKQKSDNNGSLEISNILRHSSRTENSIHEISDNPLRKNSLPFNISTRNSPRMFDTRPYRSSLDTGPNAETQGDVVVLHTRKGIYTKTVPVIHAKEKSDSHSKEASSVKDSTAIENNHINVKESEVPSQTNDDRNIKNRNIFDKMGLTNDNSNHDVRLPPDEAILLPVISESELSVEKKLLADEEILLQTSPSQRENESITSMDDDKLLTDLENPPTTKTTQSPAVPNVNIVSNGPTSPQSTSSSEPNLSRNLKSVDNNAFLKFDRPHHSSSAGGEALSVKDPNDSKNTITISPSYVLIKSAQMPPSVRVTPSIASKLLDFSQTSTSVSEQSALQAPVSSHSTAEGSCSKGSTIIDIIDNKSESSESTRTIPVSEESEGSLENSQVDKHCAQDTDL